jgi:hypothetical protein
MYRCLACGSNDVEVHLDAIVVCSQETDGSLIPLSTMESDTLRAIECSSCGAREDDTLNLQAWRV